MYICPECGTIIDKKECPYDHVTTEMAHPCRACGEHYIHINESFCSECLEKLYTRFRSLNEFDDTQLNIVFSVLLWNGEFSLDNISIRSLVNSRHYEETFVRSICNRFIQFMLDNFEPDEIDYIFKTDEI